MAAMALPASNALPPPKPMTSSHRSCFAKWVPRSMLLKSGSPATEKTTALMPASRKHSSNRSARAGLRPVTTRARAPNSFASGPMSRSVPAPKTILVAVANSKRMRQLVQRVRREKILKFHTRSRFGHHWRDSVTPGLIMARFFVLRRRFRVAVRFHQQETRRVILLLQNIEARDARFADACLRVGQRRFLECLDELSLHMDLHLDNEHGFSFVFRCRMPSRYAAKNQFNQRHRTLRESRGAFHQITFQFK